MDTREWITIEHTDEDVLWVADRDTATYGRLLVDDGTRRFSHDPVGRFWHEAISAAVKHPSTNEQLYLIAAVTTDEMTVPQEPHTDIVADVYYPTYLRLWSVFEALDYRIQHGHPLEYMAAIVEAHILQVLGHASYDAIASDAPVSVSQLKRLTSQTAHSVPHRVTQNIINLSTRCQWLPCRSAKRVDA